MKANVAPLKGARNRVYVFDTRVIRRQAVLNKLLNHVSNLHGQPPPSPSWPSLRIPRTIQAKLFWAKATSRTNHHISMYTILL